MFLFSLLVYILLCYNIKAILVRVEQGLVRGEQRYRSTGNGQFHSFKGIPYAAPPIGELRFKAPQPALSWKGERNATAHGPVCPQRSLGTGKYIPGNEDCLFLNVYTPTINPKASLSVLVFFHGGAFVSGSGNEDRYGPDFLLDHNVIVVTVNFRVGALGFLCLDIKEVPGNAGLKDQVAALKWVKKNICEFGGDPNNITIFGQSSGGSSVTLHALSPMSKGLFKRGIAMSGTCLNNFAIAFEPKQQGLLLAHKVGLYTEDPHEALKFLQKATVKSIVTAITTLLALDKLKEYVSKLNGFPPVVEKLFGDEHFILEEPEQLLRKGKTNQVELVLGHTSVEGLPTAVSQKELFLEVFPFYKEMLVPTIISTQRNPKNVLEVADCIKQHYFGNKEISEKTMKEFIKFYSYLDFVFDIHRFLEMWTKSGNKAYFYEFRCFSERNINGKMGLGKLWS